MQNECGQRGRKREGDGGRQVRGKDSCKGGPAAIALEEKRGLIKARKKAEFIVELSQLYSQR